MNAPLFPELRLRVDGPVARLTLARPAKANALSQRQLEHLGAAAAWLNGVPTIKVVIIDGEGQHFCGGADLADDRIGAPERTLSARIDQGRSVTTAIAEMRPVTIARLHGRVRGGGAVLAMACDLRFVVQGAELSFPEARLGWPLPWGCVPRLVREVGPMRTADLVLNCRPMSADALVAAGLALYAGAEADVDAMIDDTVANLVATPSVVLESVKSFISECADAIVPASMGRSDIWRMRAAMAQPDFRATNKARTREMLSPERFGPRGL